MSNTKILKISKDFSKTPGPRYIVEGPYSGELFRDTVLYSIIKKAIEDGDKLIVDLDGVAGYATSFLEESFGGLIRVKKLNYDDIVKTLNIISKKEEFWVDRIDSYLKDAKNEEERKNKW